MPWPPWHYFDLTLHQQQQHFWQFSSFSARTENMLGPYLSNTKVSQERITMKQILIEYILGCAMWSTALSMLFRMSLVMNSLELYRFGFSTL